MSPESPAPYPELLDGIFSRRSASVLVEPGPDAAQLDAMIRAATTVPDHGSLRPWRFVVVSGNERVHFGDALVAAARERQPDLPSAAVDKMRGKAFVAPTQVVIVSSPHPENKVAVWEQEASAACTGFALVLAAHALGLGAMWKSAPFRSGGELAAVFGLGAVEELLGWVNVGTPPVSATERATGARGGRGAVEPADVAARLTPEGLAPL